MRDQHDIPVLLTGCLAAGGAGMFLIMSVLIGFGVSTLIGREAMYLCLLLELVNLLVLHARAGALLRSGKGAAALSEDAPAAPRKRHRLADPARCCWSARSRCSCSACRMRPSG
jgi:hypothetical protein